MPDLIMPSARHWKTYAAITDVDAIKTSIATALTEQTYTGAAINGALAAGIRFPQVPTVTTSAAPATYNTADAIVFTGTDEDGNAVTASVTLTNAGGNETVQAAAGLGATRGMATVTKIVVPAMLQLGGALEFGVGDLVLFAAGTKGLPAWRLRAGGAGNIICCDQDGNADTLPAVGAGESWEVLAARVVAVGTTALPVTIQR